MQNVHKNNKDLKIFFTGELFFYLTKPLMGDTVGVLLTLGVESMASGEGFPGRAGANIELTKSPQRLTEPIANRNFSGKFMVRLLPEAHRKLAIQAAESGVSLNRLASAKLSK